MTLELYFIYDHPSGHPAGWVVRRHVMQRIGETRADPAVQVFHSPDEAREYIWKRLPKAALLQSGGDEANPHVFEMWG